LIRDVNPFIYSHPLRPEDIIDRDAETPLRLEESGGYRAFIALDEFQDVARGRARGGRRRRVS
jgi:hypothetical protein